jgi:hypothetical protein
MAVAAKRRGHALRYSSPLDLLFRNKNKRARKLNLTVARWRSHHDEVVRKPEREIGTARATPAESFITAAIVLIPSAVP